MDHKQNQTKQTVSFLYPRILPNCSLVFIRLASILTCWYALLDFCSQSKPEAPKQLSNSCGCRSNFVVTSRNRHVRTGSVQSIQQAPKTISRFQSVERTARFRSTLVLYPFEVPFSSVCLNLPFHSFQLLVPFCFKFHTKGARVCRLLCTQNICKYKQDQLYLTDLTQ